MSKIIFVNFKKLKSKPKPKNTYTSFFKVFEKFFLQKDATALKADSKMFKKLLKSTKVC